MTSTLVTKYNSFDIIEIRQTYFAQRSGENADRKSERNQLTSGQFVSAWHGQLKYGRMDSSDEKGCGNRC